MNRRIIIIGSVAAVLALAVCGAAAAAGAYWFATREDSGVTACKAMARDKAAGREATAEQGREYVRQLRGSRHDDLREAGDAMAGPMAGGRTTAADLRDTIKAGVLVIAACERHGVKVVL